MNNMMLKTEGDKYVIVTRRFAASPEAVYRAHTDPKLVRQLMLGPEGWTMPVSINKAKPGGKIRNDHIGGDWLLSMRLSQQRCSQLHKVGSLLPIRKLRLWRAEHVLFGR